MTYHEFSEKMSYYLSSDKPFLFLVDFEAQSFFISLLEDSLKNGVLYDIKGKTNAPQKSVPQKLNLDFTPIKREFFSNSFDNVVDEIKKGNSYLLNLTFPTEIESNLSLEEIFYVSKAPYKLLFRNEFVVFSPECFIKIEGGNIFTYPMKGTIDANIDNATELLLSNKKEEWEHNTVVDLLRNDISMIAENVVVTKYRYIDKIKTCFGEILQTSSEIKGELPQNWKENFAEKLVKMLPAGSISGAPKKKTLEIIHQNEIVPRGYYTGIFGIYDGNSLDSAVAIRYIEQNKEKTYFKSGCGITANSQKDEEYNELNQKIYVPTI